MSVEGIVMNSAAVPCLKFERFAAVPKCMAFELYEVQTLATFLCEGQQLITATREKSGDKE